MWYGFTGFSFFILFLFSGRCNIPLQPSVTYGFLWIQYLTGQAVTSNRFSRCMQRAWKEAGLKSHISTTALRKTTVTTVTLSFKSMDLENLRFIESSLQITFQTFVPSFQVYEDDPTQMETLRTHMTHSAGVQERYYNLSKKRQTTAKAILQIKSSTYRVSTS